MPTDSLSWSRHHMPGTTVPQSLSHPVNCLSFLAEMCWMSSPTPQACSLWTRAIGSNMTKPPTHPTTPSMLPCNIQRCRGLLWCAEELHMSSFCTQKHEDVIYLSLSLQPKYSLTDTSPYKVLCIRVCIPEESFNLFSVEWLVICEHNVPDKTFVMEHVNVLLLVLEPWQCP